MIRIHITFLSLPMFLILGIQTIHALIWQIESRNNGLEMQSVNNKGLVEELEKLLDRLRIPQEVWCRENFYSFPET